MTTQSVPKVTSVYGDVVQAYRQKFGVADDATYPEDCIEQAKETGRPITMFYLSSDDRIAITADTDEITEADIQIATTRVEELWASDDGSLIKSSIITNLSDVDCLQGGSWKIATLALVYATWVLLASKEAGVKSKPGDQHVIRIALRNLQLLCPTLLYSAVKLDALENKLTLFLYVDPDSIDDIMPITHPRVLH